MIARELTDKLQGIAGKMPILSLTGPRQSGKTTLIRQCFPSYDYVNLEKPDERAFAQQDPNGFLERLSDGVILDEVQRVPELFSYIQVLSDEQQQPGAFILTGSQNFLLLEKISQSLAGRVAIFHLLPFSMQELSQAGKLPEYAEEAIWKGCYPPIFDKELEPSQFYDWYVQTYLERDVRQVVNIKDAHVFEQFLGLCAGRIGQVLNYNSLASDAGVDVKTVKNWLSLLEASFVLYFLRPHHRNFNKRLVKSPKLYFHDTGLACNLLGIEKGEQVRTHYLKGALFENMVINEVIKSHYNQGRFPKISYWRDNAGHEVDLVSEARGQVNVMEIKSSKTINASFFEMLNYYKKLSDEKNRLFLINGGDAEQERKSVKVLPWWKVGEVG